MGLTCSESQTVRCQVWPLHHVKNSSVSHLVTPNRNGKFVRRILEFAGDIAADDIACSDGYRHPVPSSPGDASSQSSGCDSRSDKSRSFCCSLM